ncbi:MAG: hypothetical protein R3281_03180 [Balneolaceae bacterium]|nr:hypothetical protein [Balneolaceae bacterium]
MILLLLMLLAVSFVFTCRVVTKQLAKSYRESLLHLELQQIFRWFWDGTPEDRLYAWYKVRSVLKQRQGGKVQRKIARVDQIIMELDKRALCGSCSVSPEGVLLLQNDLEIG